MEKEHINLTLFLKEKDYTQINRVLKFHITGSNHLGTVLGVVSSAEVSCTYILNRDYSIGILVEVKKETKFFYNLFVRQLEEIHDIVNVNGRKHQLEIKPF